MNEEREIPKDLPSEHGNEREDQQHNDQSSSPLHSTEQRAVIMVCTKKTRRQWPELMILWLVLIGVSLSSVTAFSVSPLIPVKKWHMDRSSRLHMSLERRHFLGSILAGTSFLLPPPPAAQARGLVQFPCTRLENTYHFIRAGESLMEEDDIWSTNPLFLTNRDSALSEEGIQQVEATCQSLKDRGVNPTIVMYSLAASAMDTANIIGRELRLGRDRIVPEFTYLDPRAIGKWDMLPMSSTEAAVWAMDADEAGADGRVCTLVSTRIAQTFSTHILYLFVGSSTTSK